MATLGLFLAIAGAAHGETGGSADVQPWARLRATALFYAGRALEAGHRWSEAADLYSKVVELDTTGPLAGRAAAAALFARQRALNFDPRVRLYFEADEERAKVATGPLPFSNGVIDLLAAYDVYFAHAPDEQAWAPLKLRRALIYYDHNQLDASRELFREVFEHYPETIPGGYAAGMVAGILASQGRARDLRTWVEEVSARASADFGGCGPAPYRLELSEAYEAEGLAYEALARSGSPSVVIRSPTRSARYHRPDDSLRAGGGERGGLSDAHVSAE
jgi:tetratricopeptide (TPR) repeat protein